MMALDLTLQWQVWPGQPLSVMIAVSIAIVIPSNMFAVDCLMGYVQEIFTEQT